MSSERLGEFKRGEYKKDNISYCHIHCEAKKMELFDDETGIVTENMLKQWTRKDEIPQEAMRKIIADCIKESEDKKEDKCFWAFSGSMCIKEWFETGCYRLFKF